MQIFKDFSTLSQFFKERIKEMSKLKRNSEVLIFEPKTKKQTTLQKLARGSKMIVRIGISDPKLWKSKPREINQCFKFFHIYLNLIPFGVKLRKQKDLTTLG